MALFLFVRAFLAQLHQSEAGAWVFFQGQLCSRFMAGRRSRRAHPCAALQEQPPAHENLRTRHKAVPRARSSPLLAVGTAGEGQSGCWRGAEQEEKKQTRKTSVCSRNLPSAESQDAYIKAWLIIAKQRSEETQTFAEYLLR